MGARSVLSSPSRSFAGPRSARSDQHVFAILQKEHTATTKVYQENRNVHRSLTVARCSLPQAAAASKREPTQHDAELPQPLLAGPPVNFDFRAETAHISRQWVEQHAPQLRDLMDDGTLVALPRPPGHTQRRSDGFREPAVVLLVGTAHVSRRSQHDVARVIRAVRPHSVVVELCRGRSAALADPAPAAGGATRHQHAGQDPSPSPSPSLSSSPTVAAVAPVPPLSSSSAAADVAPQRTQQDPSTHSMGLDGNSRSRSRSSAAEAPGQWVNPLNLAGSSGGGGGGGGGGGNGGGGGGFWGAVARSAALGGQSALLLRVLLAALARRTAGALGVAGGGEFAAARAAAEEVGAQLVLGDRPVEITLGRAWGALPLRRRLALCWELARAAVGSAPSGLVLSEELVERLKSDDAVSALIQQLSTSYPELVAPLVTERDMYLAWSLKRSKAVNGADCVVGVVGRGHLRGVVYALLRDEGGAGLRYGGYNEPAIGK